MKKGFTLVELLVVIAILGVLATVVVLVLNPAELVRQGRDTTRIADLRTLQSALSYYLTTAASPSWTVSGTTARCTASTTTPFAVATTCNLVTSTAVNGSGWVGANLTESHGGSPIGALPLDPRKTGVLGGEVAPDNSIYQYAFAASSTSLTFELNTRLESVKYSPLMSSDGGDKNSCTPITSTSCWYEVGTAPGLAL